MRGFPWMSVSKHIYKSNEKKIDKLDITKMKSFLDFRGTIKKVQRQPIKWGKILQIIHLVRDLYQ